MLEELSAASLAALDTVLSNLRDNPNDERFRVLRKDNVHVRAKLVNCCAAMQLLESVGFVDTGDGFLAFKGGSVHKALEAVRHAREQPVRWAVRETPDQRVQTPTDQWAQVYGLDNAKRELQGIDTQKVVMLYGPPGCGKTMLARCVARAFGRGVLLTVYGEELACRFSRAKHEDQLRRHYDRARSLAPCTLLVKGGDSAAVLASIDACRRDGDRVLVFVVVNDSASLTPRTTNDSYAARLRLSTRAAGLGGCDVLVHVPPPTADARARLLVDALAKRRGDLDVDDLAAQMDGFSMRAVVEVAAAARRAATRRRAAGPVLDVDFDAVFDDLPSFATLRDPHVRGLVCDWVDGRLVWLELDPPTSSFSSQHAKKLSSSAFLRRSHCPREDDDFRIAGHDVPPWCPPSAPGVVSSSS